jgi:ABC-type multidrug transport system fused ATPase/permease subunit
VLEVLDVEPDIQDRPDALHLERVEGAIKFENVCFAYESERPVLHHINLTVLPGDAVAIVGPTGAGKTTLASLVARFYDPTSGRVLLDGHDLRELTVRTLRDKVALVLQEPILFSSSIRENIAYGQPGATMDEIEAAAQAANAHDFICALPNGYDSEVGERGVRLSGGERQRVAIARAFLKDAPVLILDEPTSSIDSRTEAVILDALDRLMVGRTTFIIAHRLSTIRSADHILVCDKGHIVERGTHDELLRYDGLYCQLHQIQSGSLVEDRKKKVAG